MASPLFDAFWNARGANGNMNNPIALMQQFINFKRNFNGNAQEEVQKIINSGKYSQQQINQAQNMANQMQGLIGLFMKNR